MTNVKQFLEVNRKEPNKVPVEVRQSNFNEIYHNFSKEQAMEQADRCLDCGNPYCQDACPVHNYIPNWLQLVAEGRFMDAAHISNQTSALPEICGRICPQDRLCERACTLENTDFEAVTIGAIEKFITDYAFENGFKPLTSSKKIAKTVSIIGAGPAGMACANVLSRNGLKVVVYDRQKEIGGLLTFGIPNFKLDKKIVFNRRKQLEAQGVEFILNTEIGELEKQLSFNEIKKNSDAVFLAMGTYNSIDGKLKGSDLKGVYKALPYLIAQINYSLNFNKDKLIDLKDKTVVVLGGGDTAMDCNRTAIRQGAKKVICAYRRDAENMPGSKKETVNASEEGTEFIYNAQPIAIFGKNNQVEGIEFAKTNLSKKDKAVKKEGRQKFEITKETFKIKADAILIAFGFKADYFAWFIQHKILINAKGLTDVRGVSDLLMQSSNANIFTGGDMYRGSSLVVNAINDGQNAAKSILKYLEINSTSKN